MKTNLTRSERTEERRAKILQAALHCFHRLGYTATTMEDIRRRSRASTGSIYHHFTSKEQLAAALYLEGIRDYQAGFQEVLTTRSDAREGVYAVVRYHLQWVEDNPTWSGFLFAMRHADFMTGNEAGIAQLNRDFARTVERWVKRQVKEGGMRKLPRDMFFSILLGPCQEFVRQWTAGIAVSDMRNVAEELGRAAWLSLRAEGGKAKGRR